MTTSDDLTALGALAEPSRRALYDHVAAADSPVSREHAATAVGLPVHSAKFHLDRLVEAGLLEVEFKRLSGRSGPGAGRPTKLYRRAGRTVDVSLPPRRYDLAGAILAAAIDAVTTTGGTLPAAVATAAATTGRELAAQPPAPRARRPLARVAQLLERHGYEPRLSPDGTELALDNCPFDRLARDHTDLVCAMNLALVDGAIEGLGCPEVRTRLEPTPEHCCVRATTT
ncbi:helix-turn-helix transcriptional regulator [Pedococcus sp. P5_B7]